MCFSSNEVLKRAQLGKSQLRGIDPTWGYKVWIFFTKWEAPGRAVDGGKDTWGKFFDTFNFII